MAIYDLLPKFNYIEPNNLKGLQAGFVVAQMSVASTASALLKDVNGVKYMENGTLCTISEDGIVAPAQGKPLFICYSEPLNTFLREDRFFAVNVAEECPRLVQLIPGDEWMSTKELTLEDAALSGRIVEITDSQDKWYSVTTMANGDAGHHYMFIG